jgi:hypothetical protein
MTIGVWASATWHNARNSARRVALPCSQPYAACGVNAGMTSPGLDEPRLLRLPASQFGHRAWHEEPVERFLGAVMFDVLERGLAPALTVPGDYGVEVEAVGFDVLRTAKVRSISRSLCCRNAPRTDKAAQDVTELPGGR